MPSADAIRIDLNGCRRHRRADTCSCRCRSSCSRARASRRTRRDREGAPGRCARDPRRLPGGGHRAVESRGLGADFAVGGSVKWLCGGPGAGYLYVRPDLADTLQPGIRRLGGARAPFDFAPARCATPRHRNDFRAARQRAGAVLPRAPATRSSVRSACPRSARSRCADPAADRRRARSRLPSEYATRAITSAVAR